MRARREEHDLSQAELAERIGVTRNTISRWENGWNQPTRPQRRKLAKALGSLPEAYEWTGADFELRDRLAKNRLEVRAWSGGCRSACRADSPARRCEIPARQRRRTVANRPARHRPDSALGGGIGDGWRRAANAASTWGTRGRRFKSDRPDAETPC